MDEFLSSSPCVSASKYKRLIAIAYIDLLVNLPSTLVILATSIAEGKILLLNHSYIGWKNVHDGAGGMSPGTYLSTIQQTPASEWGANKWRVYQIKWSEWIYVLHAAAFFGVFGTTPEMRRHYKEAFWYIPKLLGYRSTAGTSVDSLPEMIFNAHPDSVGAETNR